MRLPAILFIVLCVLPFAGAMGQDDESVKYEKLNWDPPSKELLEQKYCPLDSSADAMVVQKDMEFLFVEGNLNIITRRRVKIYTDNGLSYAEFKEYYDDWTYVKSIEACSYDANGNETELDSKDIHDEVLLKSEKGDVRFASKSFAVPNVTAGSVVDEIARIESRILVTPPVFTFQEDIPVGMARFTMNPKPSRYYTYHFTYSIANRELINPTPYMHEHNFVCEARDIPAIEKEAYPLPRRNLVTALWINVKGANILGDEFDFASSWDVYLKDYRKDFEKAFESSKKIGKLADSLMSANPDSSQWIRIAHNLVRDRWGNERLFAVGGAPSNMNDFLKRKALDPEDKAILLWGLLKHMGIESEVVWVCSDNSEYSPMAEVPSRRMFDAALTWVPSDSFFLNPGDPGGEVGILDEALSGRLMCRPMAEKDFISYTPEKDQASGIMIDLKLSPFENGSVTGTGKITYYSQDAIGARRIFRTKGSQESTSALDSLLFRNKEGAVKSFTIAPDSIQRPEMFQVTCDLQLEKFFDPTESDFDLAVYPGPTFEITTLDYNPPRKYPIYFDSKERYVYSAEWDFGDLFHPTNTEGLNLAVNVTLLDYKLLTDYDSTLNVLKVRRQYNRIQKLFQPRFTPSFERFLQDSKKCDLSTIPVVKN
jgi:hypothetical protein